jgi:hypothetical protein
MSPGKMDTGEGWSAAAQSVEAGDGSGTCDRRYYEATVADHGRYGWVGCERSVAVEWNYVDGRSNV